MFRDYAWSYFAVHADQRMKTFNSFLLASGLLAGGITTLLKGGGDIRWITPLGCVLSALSLAFWKLDQRVRQLVRNGEEAVKLLDSQHGFPAKDGIPDARCIFARDDHFTGAASSIPLATAHWSYTKCHGFVFFFFFLLGLFFAIGCHYIR